MESTPQETPSTRRRWTSAVIAAVTVSAAVFGANSVRESSATTLSVIVPIVEDSDLYTCKNSNPGVAARYEDGDFSIDGDWYLLAQNTDASYDCARMIFRVRGEYMHQSMLYVGEGDDDDDDNGFFIDGEDYWWNITEKQVHKKESGLWKSEKNRFWSEVWTVGEYKGSKWFGWYICGPAVKATRRGIAYILKDSVDADDGFYSMVKREMKAAGLFEYGIGFEETSQTDNCDYTFPTAGL